MIRLYSSNSNQYLIVRIVGIQLFMCQFLCRESVEKRRSRKNISVTVHIYIFRMKVFAEQTPR